MNQGAAQLVKLLTEHGSKTALAREVGIHPYQLSHILKGKRRPNVEQRAWFEDHLKIGWRLWDVAIEVSKVAKPAKRSVLTAKPLARVGSARKSQARGAA